MEAAIRMASFLLLCITLSVRPSVIILFRTTFLSLSTPRLAQQPGTPYLSPPFVLPQFSLQHSSLSDIPDILCFYISFVCPGSQECMFHKGGGASHVNLFCLLQHVWYTAGPLYTLAERMKKYINFLGFKPLSENLGQLWLIFLHDVVIIL